MEVCSVSGLRPNDHCRAAGTVHSDYFIARFAPSWLCDYHADLLPIDDPVEEEPDPEEPDPEEPDPEEPDPEEPDPEEPDPEEPDPEEPDPEPEPPPNWWEQFGN